MEDIKHKYTMGNYDDIIHLPHHVSSRHPRMSMQNRAAQFAPFAALADQEATPPESAKDNPPDPIR